jgi:hypothetical protein
MFADYNGMFSDTPRYVNNTALQNIELTQALLEWGIPSATTYDDFVPEEDFSPPMVVDVDYEAAILDNEDAMITFNVHDFGNSLSGLTGATVVYAIDSGDDVSVAAVQTGFASFEADLGTFNAMENVEFYIVGTDAAGYTYQTDPMDFDVGYSDTLAPEITGFALSTTTVYPTTTVGASATVTDVADTDEVVSGIDTTTYEYSTDSGTTWTTFTGNLPTFTVGTTVQVRVVAVDMAGNTATSSVLSFTVIEEPVETTTTTTETPAPPVPGFEGLSILLALGAAVAILYRRRR